jgi:hypothetical protein
MSTAKYKGDPVHVIRRGGKNTRIATPGGEEITVPNEELTWEADSDAASDAGMVDGVVPPAASIMPRAAQNDACLEPSILSSDESSMSSSEETSPEDISEEINLTSHVLTDEAWEDLVHEGEADRSSDLSPLPPEPSEEEAPHPVRHITSPLPNPAGAVYTQPYQRSKRLAHLDQIHQTPEYNDPTLGPQRRPRQR